MFHVKHPAALGAVAAHQEEVRAGSSSRFALRTLRPAPSSPCACAGSADAKGVGAVRTHSSAQAQPRIISRREARTDFKDPSATFSTSWQASGSKTIFRMIDRLQPIEKLVGKPLVGAFGGFLNLPRSRKSCREARFFYSSCTSGRLAEGPLPSEYASHETPRRRCRRHAA